MKAKAIQQYLLYLLLISLFLHIDVKTKYFFTQKPLWEITSWFKFELAYNHGSAFSLPIPQVITIILGVILGVCVIGLPLFPSWKQKVGITKTPNWLLAFIAAGILGNTIDRVAYGVVVDFIAIGRWPTFNVADIYLTTGVLILLLIELRQHYFLKK